MYNVLDIKIKYLYYLLQLFLSLFFRIFLGTKKTGLTFALSPSLDNGIYGFIFAALTPSATSKGMVRLHYN